MAKIRKKDLQFGRTIRLGPSKLDLILINNYPFQVFILPVLDSSGKFEARPSRIYVRKDEYCLVEVIGPAEYVNKMKSKYLEVVKQE